MPAFSLLSIDNIGLAVNSVANVRGAYQAVDILTKSISDVEEPPEFESDVKELESKQGPLYQSPDKTRRSMLKAAKIGAHANPQYQDTVAELASLVLTRLGATQGTKVLSFLLMAAGYDPTLIVFVVKIGLALSRTDTGQKILEKAQPQIQQLAETSGQLPLIKPLLSTSAAAQELGATWIDKATDVAKDVTKNVTDNVLRTSDLVVKTTMDVLQLTADDIVDDSQPPSAEPPADDDEAPPASS